MLLPCKEVIWLSNFQTPDFNSVACQPVKTRLGWWCCQSISICLLSSDSFCTCWLMSVMGDWRSQSYECTTASRMGWSDNLWCHEKINKAKFYLVYSGNFQRLVIKWIKWDLQERKHIIWPKGKWFIYSKWEGHWSLWKSCPFRSLINAQIYSIVHAEFHYKFCSLYICLTSSLCLKCCVCTFLPNSPPRKSGKLHMGVTSNVLT